MRFSHQISVYTIIPQIRGEVYEETPIPSTPLVQIKAYLPVKESFGLNEALRSGTQGRAFPQMVLDHWKELPGDTLGESKRASELATSIR